jgi:hypothetical protein
VEREKGMHVILSLSLSVGPATFSSVSILSRGRECGPYLHRLKGFGDVVIVSGFAVVVVVTVTCTYVKNRRKGGGLFVVDALTEVVCGDDVQYLEVSKRPFSSVERHVGRQVCNQRQSSSVARQLYSLPKEGVKQSFECRCSLPGGRVGRGQARRWCGRGESEPLKGPYGLGRHIGAKPEQKRAARGRQ